MGHFSVQGVSLVREGSIVIRKLWKIQSNPYSILKVYKLKILATIQGVPISLS